MNYQDMAEWIYNGLGAKEWLKMNASLQKKKQALRSMLKDKGVLKRQGDNNYDRYTYFTEAQYKLLFTELLPAAGLELKFNELAYDTFEGPQKQANGRMPKIEFCLSDADTGFFEATAITGEGIDKGDKAGYKAYTGALKYYLANTFLVATGDDAETESPDEKMNQKQPRNQAAPKQQNAPAQKQPQGGTRVQPDTAPDAMDQARVRPAEQSQVNYILQNCTEDQCRKIMEMYKVASLNDLSYFDAGRIIISLNKRKTEQKE